MCQLIKLKSFMNGVDLERYNPFHEKDKSFAKNYGLNNKFIIGYIGTHGLAHALEKM